jgi:hypothetical protein
MAQHKLTQELLVALLKVYNDAVLYLSDLFRINPRDVAAYTAGVADMEDLEETDHYYRFNYRRDHVRRLYTRASTLRIDRMPNPKTPNPGMVMRNLDIHIREVHLARDMLREMRGPGGSLPVSFSLLSMLLNSLLVTLVACRNSTTATPAGYVAPRWPELTEDLKMYARVAGAGHNRMVRERERIEEERAQRAEEQRARRAEEQRRQREAAFEAGREAKRLRFSSSAASRRDLLAEAAERRSSFTFGAPVHIPPPVAGAGSGFTFSGPNMASSSGAAGPGSKAAFTLSGSSTAGAGHQGDDAASATVRRETFLRQLYVQVAARSDGAWVCPDCPSCYPGSVDRCPHGHMTRAQGREQAEARGRRSGAAGSAGSSGPEKRKRDLLLALNGMRLVL